MQVAETAEVYSNKVLPYMQSLPASRITWVYNILEKKVRAAGYTLLCLTCDMRWAVALEAENCQAT